MPATARSHDWIGGVGHLQDGPTASRPTYLLIQVLRACAALMVVGFHSTFVIRNLEHQPIHIWGNGSGGVDIFFVISGFVMTISSAPLRDAAHPARTFLARRLERLVPMYWIATVAAILIALYGPAYTRASLGTAWHQVASFLFVASATNGQLNDPLLFVGWSLNFEMAFYVLFAVALAMRASLLKVVAPVLIVVTVLAFLPHPGISPAVSFYADPMLLDFLGGILLAMAVPQVRRMAKPTALLLLIAGWSLFLGGSWMIHRSWRAELWGCAGIAIIAAAVALEHPWGRRMPRWLLELGDASYSIYLVHALILPHVGMLLAKWSRHDRIAAATSMAALLTTASLSGVLVYRLIERPITNWFKGRRRTAIPAVA
jgi:exopolysaccharide production protein ExoZ